jgi:hypothetical protein
MSVRLEWLPTARLSLRRPTRADAPSVLRILSNRSVVEHNPSDLVRPGNLASQRVARKIGLRRDPNFDDQGADGLDWAFTSRSHHGSPMRSDL